MNTSTPTARPLIAPLWRRALARIIDLIFLLLLSVGALYVLAKLDLEHFPITDFLLLAVAAIYEILIPSFSGGASVGRFIAHLSLRRESGDSPPSILQYAARTFTRLALFAVFAIFVAYELDLMGLYAVLVVEAIACAINKRHQTLGDLVARTVVTTRTESIADST